MGGGSGREDHICGMRVIARVVGVMMSILMIMLIVMMMCSDSDDDPPPCGDDDGMGCEGAI